MIHSYDDCPAMGPGCSYSDLAECTCPTCRFAEAKTKEAWDGGFGWGVVRSLALEEGPWTATRKAEVIFERCVADGFSVGLQISGLHRQILERIDQEDSCGSPLARCLTPAVTKCTVALGRYEVCGRPLCASHAIRTELAPTVTCGGRHRIGEG